MFRKMLLVSVIGFCVLSFFFSPFVSVANSPTEVPNAATVLNNMTFDMNRAVKDYGSIRSTMDSLNGDFDSNQKAIAKDVSTMLKIGGGAIVSGAVAIKSGGSLAPAAYAALLAMWSGGDAVKKSVSAQDLIKAMGITQGVLGTALSNVKATYYGGTVTDQDPSDSTKQRERETVGYAQTYQSYLKALAEHLGWGPDALDTSVNTNYKYSGYYHPGDSGSGMIMGS